MQQINSRKDKKRKCVTPIFLSASDAWKFRCLWWDHEHIRDMIRLILKSSTVKASVEDRSNPPLSKNPIISRSVPSELVWCWQRHYFIAPSCGSARKKARFMHQPKHGAGKLFHFSGVCFSSPWVFSQMLHYFWNQSRLPGTGLTFESITTRLHQKPRGNAEDDTGKMKESRPPAYFIAYFMSSVLA